MERYIFFDFDEMLFKTRAVLVSFMNSKYNINSIEDDYLGNNKMLHEIIMQYDKEAKVTLDEVYRDHTKNLNDSWEAQKNIKVIDGAEEVISMLSKKYKLYVVTARQKSDISVIYGLLEKYFPRCFCGIHCVWEWVEGSGYQSFFKRDFIYSIKGEKLAFFDDSPKEILEMTDIIPSYLFDPYKQHPPINCAGVVNSWKEIGDLFL